MELLKNYFHFHFLEFFFILTTVTQNLDVPILSKS